MGFFKNRQEKESPVIQEEPHYHHPLLEIVRIVSSNNPEILDSARKCMKNTEKYYQYHLEDYEDRGMSLKDSPAVSPVDGMYRSADPPSVCLRM